MSDIDPGVLRAAVVSPRYAALVRADLPIAAIATWDARLPRDTRLVVPLDVQALVVAPGVVVDQVPTETVVPITMPGTADEQVLPVPPAPFGAPTARAVGVHLHWAMPDGLTRGDAGRTRSTPEPAGNPMGLPALPDRWVVVRLVHGVATARSWVLESDRGDHHDLLGWKDPGVAPANTTVGVAGRRYIQRDKLTAVAGGDLAWAATYDAVIDRFAFHDDLADLDPTTLTTIELSYLVAGWWSDPALDPLHDVTSLGAYHQRTTWLGWFAPTPEGVTEEDDRRATADTQRRVLTLKAPGLIGAGYQAATAKADEAVPVTMASSAYIADDAKLFVHDRPSAPRQTIVHGSVFGVSLAASDDLAPKPADLELAIGPTTSAALAAMLAAGSDDQRRSSEQVLAAFTGGLLPTIDGPSGLVAVDEHRHGSTFVGQSAGLRATPDRIAEGDIMTTKGGRSASTTASAVTSSAVTSSAATSSATKDVVEPTGSQAEMRRRKQHVELVHKERADVLASSIDQRHGSVKQPLPPRSYRDVPASEPRFFLPADLAVLVRGAVRSLRHGFDGRHLRNGQLGCRLPSAIAHEIDGVLDGRELPQGLRSLGSGSVPPELDLLLQEAVLTDPYRWDEITNWSSGQRGLPVAEVGTRVKAEMALRYAFHADSRTTAPTIDDHVRDGLRPLSAVAGEDMSPVGWTRWTQPWVPLWCDWQLDLAVDDQLAHWHLGTIDFEPDEGVTPDGATAFTVTGRTLLTASSGTALSREIGSWLEEERKRDEAKVGQVSDRREAELAEAQAAADGLDVLSATLRGVRETLLGLNPLDAMRMPINDDGTTKHPPRALAAPMLLAGGKAVLRRVRIVDAFGRFVDVPDAVLATAEVADTIRHAAGAPTIALAPRWQRPSRLLFRFVDPRVTDGGNDVEARIDQQHPDLAVSPLAGWLLPDHVDEALEFFDASGRSLGQLMHDPVTGAVMWESAPGRTGPIGGPPDPGPDPGARHLTRLAAGLVTTDARVRNGPDAALQHDSALSALLRAIDTTLWTTDPLGSVGTGAVAGLVGRPIAVVRATLRFDIADDLDALTYAPPADRAAREAAYRDVLTRVVRVRLGELTRTDDGLLAYAVDDDYSTMQVVAPEVRSLARASGRRQGQLSVFGRGSELLPAIRAIDHPYLAPDTDVAARLGYTVRLTLLMAPGGKVHATCAVVPRKSLALARDWFHDTLTKLSPSFRVGPVLVDPTGIRMPRVTGLGDQQVFTRRDTPLTWKDDPILAASQSALLPEQPHHLQEGWIRVLPVDDTKKKAP